MPDFPDEGTAVTRRRTQTIRVSIRNLRTDQFITAGYAFDVDIPRLPVVPSLDGVYIAPRTLRRGDTYTARVYTPRPDGEPAPPGGRRLRRRARVLHDDPRDDGRACRACGASA